MEQEPKQYSPDGHWLWDGAKWVSISTGQPYSSGPKTKNSEGWASEIPGLRHVPGFRSSTWWRAVPFALYYCVLGLFALILAVGHAWGGSLFFASWIVFAVAISYAWTLRRRVARFVAAAGVALLSMGGCVTGMVISPAPAAQTHQQSSA